MTLLPRYAAWLLAATSLGLGSANAQPEPADEPAIVWTRTLGEAVRAGISTRRPILIHFNRDDDAACNEIARVHLKNPELVELSRRFVCLICSPNDHRNRSKKAASCTRFGCKRCKEHQRAWTVVSKAVSRSDRPTAPQFVFLRPDRTQILRRHGPMEAYEIMEAMKRALSFYENPKQMDGMEARRFKTLKKLATSHRVWERPPAMKELARFEFPAAMKFLRSQALPEAGEMLRQGAVKAMKDAHNVNTLPIIIPLLREQSGQLRRNAVFALRNLGMVEAAPPMLACYKRENTSRMKSLLLRVMARLDGKNKEIHRIHRIALRKAGPLLRIHAIRACVDLDIPADSFKLLTDIVASATSLRVQAVACYATTEILLRSERPEGNDVVSKRETVDGYGRLEVSENARKIARMKDRLHKSLVHVAKKGRTDEIRALAEKCLDALEGESPEPFRRAVLHFHDDSKDEVFKEY